MKFESRFNLNQMVYYIANRKERVFIKCEYCNGIGTIPALNGKEVRCYECSGKGGRHEYLDTKWIVDNASYTIGQVRCEITSLKKTGVFDNIGEYCEDSIECKYEYMMYQTGIRSGTIYDESNLFATREEAQLECDNRNRADAWEGK